MAHEKHHDSNSYHSRREKSVFTSKPGDRFLSRLPALQINYEMVLYPREGHFIVEWNHRINMLKRVKEFFDRHLRD